MAGQLMPTLHSSPPWIPGSGLLHILGLQQRRTKFPSVVCSARRILCLAVTTHDQAARDTSRRELAVAVGVNVIPHPDKVDKGGEDAYFVSSYNGGVVGVADGVGGWAAENVDPAFYSKELMAHAAAAVASEEMDNNAQVLLQKAYAATCSVGAATAIVAILDRKGTLHIANLGDCGLRILRCGRVVFATSPQQHYFDCPYQFSSEGAQSAADAAVHEVEVKEGDTIVMGSDGLFDNVYNRDIEATLSVFGGFDQESAERSAMALAALASKHARDVNYESPYIQEAVVQGLDVPWWKKLLGKKLTGGKLDDITVVVAHVVVDAQAPPEESPVDSRVVLGDFLDRGLDTSIPTDEQPNNARPSDIHEQAPEAYRRVGLKMSGEGQNCTYHNSFVSGFTQMNYNQFNESQLIV